MKGGGLWTIRTKTGQSMPTEPTGDRPLSNPYQEISAQITERAQRASQEGFWRDRYGTPVGGVREAFDEIPEASLQRFNDPPLGEDEIPF